MKSLDSGKFGPIGIKYIHADMETLSYLHKKGYKVKFNKNHLTVEK